MALHLPLSRQRVPMLDASTLEDRTRPLVYMAAAARLRYFLWPQWRAEQDSAPTYQVMPTAAKLGRR